MVVLGTFVLAFGWLGFNAGSTLAGTEIQIGVIAANTMLASAAGGFSSYVYVTRRFGKPDVTMMCNGMLAGLVAITAPCAFVSAGAAVVIGAVAGVLVIMAAVFIEQKLKVDDPCGAAAVHGVNGAWGVLALGIFANGKYGDKLNGVDGGVRGWLYGDHGQFFAECIGLVVNLVFVGSMATVSLYVINRFVGNRVSEEIEQDGLDEAEMGLPGYTADGPRTAMPELAPIEAAPSVVVPEQRTA
jgi:ammonium transporter, Amt family